MRTSLIQISLKVGSRVISVSSPTLSLLAGPLTEGLQISTSQSFIEECLELISISALQLLSEIIGDRTKADLKGFQESLKTGLLKPLFQTSLLCLPLPLQVGL